MQKNKLQTSGQQSGIATLPDSALQKAVFKFSMLRAFPLSEIEILEWARVIENANVDIGALKFVILKMQTCEMDYNEREGIQNIFRNLRLVKKSKYNDGGKWLCEKHKIINCESCFHKYEILKPIW